MSWPSPSHVSFDVQFLPANLPSSDFATVAERAARLQKQSADRDWYAGQSDIEGTGIFAGRDYKAGDVIGVAMTDGGEDELGLSVWNLTFLARYCNHQQNSNAETQKQGDSYMLVASRDIERDQEITANYYQVSRGIGPQAEMKWNGSPVPRRASLDSFVELTE